MLNFAYFVPRWLHKYNYISNPPSRPLKLSTGYTQVIHRFIHRLCISYPQVILELSTGTTQVIYRFSLRRTKGEPRDIRTSILKY